VIAGVVQIVAHVTWSMPETSGCGSLGQVTSYTQLFNTPHGDPMIRKLIVPMAIACTATLLSVAQAAAQVRVRSVDSILSGLRAHGNNFEHAASILAERTDDSSPARRDSLAEGLVRIALDPSARAAPVITAFVLSSHPSHSRRYPGAFDRLYEIYSRASRAGARGAALGALGRVGQLARAMDVWRDVALSPRDTSFLAAQTRALENLCRQGGERGRAILRDLHESRSVIEPLAAHQLEIMIRTDFQFACGR
jgi:hypothetical protein